MDWDEVAAEVGLPANWREMGYDSPEYMVTPDSVYRPDPNGRMSCYPCQAEGRVRVFRSTDVGALFRHVHTEH